MLNYIMVNFLPLDPNEQKRDILHFSVQGGDEYNGTNVIGTNQLVQIHKWEIGGVAAHPAL